MVIIVSFLPLTVFYSRRPRNYQANFPSSLTDIFYQIFVWRLPPNTGSFLHEAGQDSYDFGHVQKGFGVRRQSKGHPHSGHGAKASLRREGTLCPRANGGGGPRDCDREQNSEDGEEVEGNLPLLWQTEICSPKSEEGG